jgi:hypothetical protein
MDRRLIVGALNVFGTALLERVAWDCTLLTADIVPLLITVAAIFASAITALVLARIDGCLAHDAWVGDVGCQIADSLDGGLKDSVLPVVGPVLDGCVLGNGATVNATIAA